MDSGLPLVSIVAANYNNGKYLIETLNSIAAQTYPNIELIIVDDASKDGSDQIIDEWLKTFPKPHTYIKHETNKGICATCNDLLRNANGKYISFIATDDLYLPNKIEKQVQILEQTDESVAMIYGDTYIIDEHSQRSPGTYMKTIAKFDFDKAPTGNILHELQERHFLHWLSALIKRDAIMEVGFYDESLKFEDYDMSIRVAKRFNITFIDDIHVLYRIHSQSYSRKVSDWETELMPLYFKHIDLPVFRRKASEVILNKYRKGDKSAAPLAKQYYQLTNEKFPYHSFVVNNVPPLLQRIAEKFNLFK